MAAEESETPDPSENDATICNRAERAALNKWMEVCGGRDLQKQVMARRLGLTDGSGEPIDVDCTSVYGADKESVVERRLVVCLLFEGGPIVDTPLVDQYDDFGDALEEAWTIADREVSGGGGGSAEDAEEADAEEEAAESEEGAESESEEAEESEEAVEDGVEEEIDSEAAESDAEPEEPDEADPPEAEDGADEATEEGESEEAEAEPA